jgi:hypothetical protein
MPNGWHCGEGVRTGSEVARFAQQLHTSLKVSGLSRTDVFPRPNGGIEFHVYGAFGHIELFIDPKNTFDYLGNDANDAVTEEGENLPWERARSVTMKFFSKQELLSGRSLLSADTSQKKSDCLPMLSQNLVTVREYPSSMSLVPLLLIAPSVHILRNITQVSSPIPQHI